MNTPSSSRPGKSVLVVDDDPTVRAVIGERLALAGYTVVQASDGLQAQQLLAQVRPHLILLDLQMPRVSGPELLAVLASQPSWREIPVLIVSSQTLDGPAPQHARIVGQLPKPVSLDRLLASVNETLGDA